MLAGSIVAVIGFLIVLKKRKTKKAIEIPVSPESNKKTVSELLQPAYIFSEADDKMFYNTLRNCIWAFFTEYFGLRGSNMSKASLSMAMQQKAIDETYKKAITEILDQCETGIFTSVESIGEKKKWLEQTKEVLEKIENQLK